MNGIDVERKVRRLQKSSNWIVPELFGECWLPRDAVRGGGGPGGDEPFRGLPGGRVSVMDIKLAIGLCVVADCAGGVGSPTGSGMGNGIDVG